jgi:hypothetical protein
MRQKKKIKFKLFYDFLLNRLNAQSRWGEMDSHLSYFSHFRVGEEKVNKQTGTYSTML